MTSANGSASDGLISVVVTFLNPGRYLADAVESVLSQTYDNWELLLVDDGSSDESSAVAQRYAAAQPGRIRYLSHSGNVNRGMCTSRNLGVSQSRGKYIAILDADDVWLPHKLENQAALVRTHPHAALVYGCSEYWHDPPGSSPVPDRVDVLAPSGLYQPHELLRITFPLGKLGAPCPSTFLFRRDSFELIGGFEEAFDPDIEMFEDQAFLAKFYLRLPVYVSDRCWIRYRIHQHSCSSVAARTGRYDSARRFYLDWLQAYLRRENVRDPEIWKAVRRSTWPYRHPVVSQAYRAARRWARPLKAAFGRN